MTMTKREAILAANDLPNCEVEVPEWGVSIRVRQMTVRERDEFAARGRDGAEKSSLAAWLVTLLAIDETGAQMFKPEDVEKLEGKSFKAMDRIASAILALNRIDEAQVEGARKNS